MPKDWRDKLDAQTRHDLENLTKDTVTYKQAYKASENPAISQIWIALVEISRTLSNLDRRMKTLEDIHFEKKKKGDIIKDLEKW